MTIRNYKNFKIIALDPNHMAYYSIIYNPSDRTTIVKQAWKKSNGRGKLPNGMIDMGTTDRKVTMAEIMSIVEE